jgi:MFS transporter, UMF1 family
LGGIATLGVCLAYVTAAQKAGTPSTEFVPITNLITAAIFALAALPAFLLLKERAVPQRNPGPWVKSSLARLGHTLKNAARYRDLRNFLFCLVAYQAGVQTIIALAAVYAQEAMGFTMTQTLLLVLVVNITAAIGAFAFGYVQDAVGHWKSIFLVIVLWMVTVGLAWFATSNLLFWVAANFAGLGLGASQSAARALVGYLSPRDRIGEFYGLWGLAGNVAAIIGPLTYGMVTWISGNNHRLAMLCTGGFFVLGMIILTSVNVARGRAAALEG